MKTNTSVPFSNLAEAVAIIASLTKNRNLALSGEPHYQPAKLKPFMGYDQRVLWQALVEWFILVALAHLGIMPKRDARYLTKSRFVHVLQGLTTTKVTKVERTKTKHDVLALLLLMKKRLPKPLCRWLHMGATSYDIIDTAMSLMMKETFEHVLWPALVELDTNWRRIIGENADLVTSGFTHLQKANPVMFGLTFAQLHVRFKNSARQARKLARLLHGKFSGPVGTSAAVNVLFKKDVEKQLLALLGLKRGIARQVVEPEPLVRFLTELGIFSGALANLGEDCRIMQMSTLEMIGTASSTSSAMPQKGSGKGGNPIAAENLAGMHWSVMGELHKVWTSMLVTDLQRDLRASNVMRGFGAIFTFVMQQIQTALRLFKSLVVNKDTCLGLVENEHGATAELLHLALKLYGGHSDSHTLVKNRILPVARESGLNLLSTMYKLVQEPKEKDLRKVWQKVPRRVKITIGNPFLYTGKAEAIARKEALEPL